MPLGNKTHRNWSKGIYIPSKLEEKTLSANIREVIGRRSQVCPSTFWCFFNNKYQQTSETYSEPCPKCSILHVWQGSEYAPEHIKQTLSLPRKNIPNIVLLDFTIWILHTKAKSVSLHYNKRYLAIKAYWPKNERWYIIKDGMWHW